jgi:plastocyanin
MKLKAFYLLALAAICAFALAGCAQDSTNTTDENPQMQKSVAEGGTGAAGSSAPASTTPSRTPAKGGAGSGTTKVALSTDPSGALKFNTDSLKANAGAVDVVLTNQSSTPHDVSVKTSSGKVLGTSKEITKGETTLDLKDVPAGTYTFFCSVPGHEQAGMKGTLTVR